MAASRTALTGNDSVTASSLPLDAIEQTTQPSMSEDVARLADSLWEAPGCVDGHSEEDWFRAERSLAVERRAQLPEPDYAHSTHS